MAHSRRITYSNSQSSLSYNQGGTSQRDLQMRSQGFRMGGNPSDENENIDNQSNDNENQEGLVLQQQENQQQQENIEQDLSANPQKDEVYIKVSARVRPLIQMEQNDDSIVEVQKDKNCLKIFTNNYFNNGERNFYFENVLDCDADQQQVFDSCECNQMCQAFLKQGKNCNIVLYGPTSTGKTFTMQGDIQAKGSIIKHMFETLVQQENHLVNDAHVIGKHKKTKSNQNYNLNKFNTTNKQSFIQDPQQLATARISPSPNKLPDQPFSQKEQLILSQVINNENKGLIPRVLDYIFANKPQNDKFEFRISFLEIYNDFVTDLLDSDNPPLNVFNTLNQDSAMKFNQQSSSYMQRQVSQTFNRSSKVHQIKENALKGVYIENLSEHSAKTIEEAYIYFLYGLQKKKIFATVKNQESSRSHTIFQIKLCLNISSSSNNNIHNHHKNSGSGVNRFQLQQNNNLQVISKFSLVDLAGSERLSDGEKTLERVEEAKFINKSLSALGNVIYALKNQQHVFEKQQMKRSTSHVKGKSSSNLNSNSNYLTGVHIPYRDSKLTHILKDSLGGNSHTHIIITLSPSIQSLSETLSSMKFAHNAKSIKQHVQENIFLRDFELKAAQALASSSKIQARLTSQMNEQNEQQILCLCKLAAAAATANDQHAHSDNNNDEDGDQQQSFDSDDLIELSKYYEKQGNHQSFQNSIAESKSKLNKLPKNSKILKQLFRKTLEKLRKYKNDQQTMMEKILDLEQALELKEILQFKNLEMMVNSQDTFQQIDQDEKNPFVEVDNEKEDFIYCESPISRSIDRNQRLSINDICSDNKVIRNELSKYNSKSQKCLIQHKNQIQNQETTELMNLSHTVGEEISKFISNLREDTVSHLKKNQQNMIDIIKKKAEFLSSTDQLFNLQKNLQSKFVTEDPQLYQNLKTTSIELLRPHKYFYDIDSVKASIDNQEMIKQCNEELATIPKKNMTQLAKPLIYKTMNHCAESSSQQFTYLQSYYSGYLTPKQQNVLFNNNNHDTTKNNNNNINSFMPTSTNHGCCGSTLINNNFEILLGNDHSQIQPVIQNHHQNNIYSQQTEGDEGFGCIIKRQMQNGRYQNESQNKRAVPQTAVNYQDTINNFDSNVNIQNFVTSPMLTLPNNNFDQSKKVYDYMIADETTPRANKDFLKENQSSSLIPISQLWQNVNTNSQQESSVIDRSNQSNFTKLSNIQSDRSANDKHFNFLDSSSNYLQTKEEIFAKVNSSNTATNLLNKQSSANNCINSNDNHNQNNCDGHQMSFNNNNNLGNNKQSHLNNIQNGIIRSSSSSSIMVSNIYEKVNKQNQVINNAVNQNYSPSNHTSAIIQNNTIVDEVSFETNVNSYNNKKLNIFRKESSKTDLIQQNQGVILLGVQPIKKVNRNISKEYNNSTKHLSQPSYCLSSRSIIKRNTNSQSSNNINLDKLSQSASNTNMKTTTTNTTIATRMSGSSKERNKRFTYESKQSQDLRNNQALMAQLLQSVERRNQSGAASSSTSIHNIIFTKKMKRQKSGAQTATSAATSTATGSVINNNGFGCFYEHKLNSKNSNTKTVNHQKNKSMKSGYTARGDFATYRYSNIILKQ